jgi:hypothetical protein
MTDATRTRTSTLTITTDTATATTWTALGLADEDTVLLLREGTLLSRDSIRTGIKLLLQHLDPTDLQRRRVAAGIDEPDPDRIARAAKLLAALEVAGEALGVDSEEWRSVTSLPAACWDVARWASRPWCPGRLDP